MIQDCYIPNKTSHGYLINERYWWKVETIGNTIYWKEILMKHIKWIPQHLIVRSISQPSTALSVLVTITIVPVCNILNVVSTYVLEPFQLTTSGQTRISLSRTFRYELLDELLPTRRVSHSKKNENSLKKKTSQKR